MVTTRAMGALETIVTSPMLRSTRTSEKEGSGMVRLINAAIWENLSLRPRRTEEQGCGAWFAQVGQGIDHAFHPMTNSVTGRSPCTSVRNSASRMMAQFSLFQTNYSSRPSHREYEVQLGVETASIRSSATVLNNQNLIVQSIQSQCGSVERK